MAEPPVAQSLVVAQSKEEVAFDLMCYLQKHDESYHAKILELYYTSLQAVSGKEPLPVVQQSGRPRRLIDLED